MGRDDGRVHHGVARLDLRFPGVDSLKAKRSVLRRTEARLRDDLGVAVAEVGEQDTWTRAVLGVVAVSGTAGGVDRVLDRVTAVVERDPRVEVLRVVDDADVLESDPIDLP